MKHQCDDADLRKRKPEFRLDDGVDGRYDRLNHVVEKMRHADDDQYGIYSSLLEVRLSFQTFECGCQNLVHNCKGSQNKTLVGGQYYFKYAKSMVFYLQRSPRHICLPPNQATSGVLYIYYKECLSERCSFLSDKMS